MNPDKLFDYLDGKLPPGERTHLEEQLARDPQLQKEFAAARRIHGNMHGDSREVVLEGDPEMLARGRKLALRVGTAAVILMGLNVAIGLWVIAHKTASNPNRALLDEQVKQQVRESAQRAAANAMTPPPLGVFEITLMAAPQEMDALADKVVETAKRFGGTATRGLPDPEHIGVLVDLPASRESEFRAALTNAPGTPVAPAASPNESATSATEKKSFNVQIVPQAKP